MHPLTTGQTSGESSALRATRVRLVAEVGSDAVVRREFCQPRRAFAVEESLSVDGLTNSLRGSSSADQIVIVTAPKGTRVDRHDRLHTALQEWATADKTLAVRVRSGPDEVEWRPALALVSCRPESADDVTAALVDFAFYEGELRAFEQALDTGERNAEEDVEVAHRIRYKHRVHWARLVARMETYSRMRLLFARLEPQFVTGLRGLPAASRQWFERLADELDVEARLEAASDRLEALEELYEGANQRISEYRWYREGHLLELCIVLILLVECILMSADIYAHYRERQVRTNMEHRFE